MKWEIFLAVVAFIVGPWAVTITPVFSLHFWFGLPWVASVMYGSAIAIVLLVGWVFTLAHRSG